MKERLVPVSLQRRKQAIDVLYSVVVYEAERITMQWSIQTYAGKCISGRADTGNIKIHVTDHSLEIYATRGQGLANGSSIELVECIATLCEIREPQKVMMLQYILGEPDQQQISKQLDRRGFTEMDECGMPDLGKSKLQLFKF